LSPHKRSRHRRGPGSSAVANGGPWSWTARIAAFALLFQALLPLLHTPPRPPAAADVPAWVFASLCRGATTPGPASAGDRQRSAPAKPAPVCPVCQLAQIAGTFLPPFASELPPRRQSERMVLPEAPAALTAVPRDRRPSARAPPRLA